MSDRVGGLVQLEGWQLDALTDPLKRMLDMLERIEANTRQPEPPKAAPPEPPLGGLTGTQDEEMGAVIRGAHAALGWAWSAELSDEAALLRATRALIRLAQKHNWGGGEP